MWNAPDKRESSTQRVSDSDLNRVLVHKCLPYMPFLGCRATVDG
jgi:hypothetical protein